MACLGVEPNVIHGFTNSSQLFAQVGPDEHVVCALSGGVDSTVAATLVHKVLGNRLHCVFVDNGLLRYKVRNGDTNIWWVCVVRLSDWAAHSKLSPNGLAGGVHVTLLYFALPQPHAVNEVEGGEDTMATLYCMCALLQRHQLQCTLEVQCSLKRKPATSCFLWKASLDFMYAAGPGMT